MHIFLFATYNCLYIKYDIQARAYSSNIHVFSINFYLFIILLWKQLSAENKYELSHTWNLFHIFMMYLCGHRVKKNAKRKEKKIENNNAYFKFKQKRKRRNQKWINHTGNKWRGLWLTSLCICKVYVTVKTKMFTKMAKSQPQLITVRMVLATWMSYQ